MLLFLKVVFLDYRRTVGGRVARPGQPLRLGFLGKRVACGVRGFLGQATLPSCHG